MRCQESTQQHIKLSTLSIFHLFFAFLLFEMTQSCMKIFPFSHDMLMHSAILLCRNFLLIFAPFFSSPWLNVHMKHLSHSQSDWEISDFFEKKYSMTSLVLMKWAVSFFNQERGEEKNFNFSLHYISEMPNELYDSYTHQHVTQQLKISSVVISSPSSTKNFSHEKSLIAFIVLTKLNDDDAGRQGSNLDNRMSEFFSIFWWEFCCCEWLNVSLWESAGVFVCLKNWIPNTQSSGIVPVLGRTFTESRGYLF